MIKLAVPVAMLLAFLTSCGEAPNARGAGGVSVEDAKALDEAAAKLDNDAAQSPSERKR